MQKHQPSYGVMFLLIMSLLFVRMECKGFSGSRGGGGFKGSKGAGSFGGPASYNRPSGYGMNMAKPGGSTFKKTAMSFAAGAAGGVAAYSLMRAMSGSGYQRGYYGPGYGVGETCTNNEDLNGTVFGSFRCPLNGFPYEAKYCCGERGHQFCCIREERRRISQGASHVIWITLVLIILLVIAIFWARRQRQRQKEMVMVPTEVPFNEPQGPPYYHPAPPPMGYPPPPHGNPYAPPPQAYPNNYNPYQSQQQQPGAMPYPPQQPHYNPYPTVPSY